MFTSVWAGGSNLRTSGHKNVKFGLEIDDSHYTLFKYCFTSTITNISPVLDFEVMFGRWYPHSLTPQQYPPFHYPQLVLALFQGPCYAIPPLSTFLSFISVYLYLVPTLIPYWMQQYFPTISPPTTTPSPVDGLYRHIHLLPVWSLVSVCLHQQYNYSPF